MRRLLQHCLLALFTSSGFTALAMGDDWPGFRGPNGNGIASESATPVLKWDAETNVAWKVKLPAPGNSSPILWKDMVYVTVSDLAGKNLSLLCLDRTTGAERWQQSVSDTTPEPTHSTNPYGSSTPAADAERVVVWYGDAGLHCYSHAGERLWSVETPHVRHIWGYGSSPVLHEGRVYLNTGIGEDAYLAAYDAKDGRQIWKTVEPNFREPNQRGGEVGTWCTPVFAQIDGKWQLLCAQPTRVVGYNPENGEVLWFCAGLANLPRGNLVYTSLLLGEGVGVAMGGYNGPAIGFRLGGSGDTTSANQLWRHSANNPQRIGSAVVIGKHLFQANAGPGTVQCLEMDTGKELWRARPAIGGNFWGSVVYAAGRLYATNQDGTTIVFAPALDKLEVLAENRLNERSNSTPAIAGNDLVIRTFNHLYCFRDSK